MLLMLKQQQMNILIERNTLLEQLDSKYTVHINSLLQQKYLIAMRIAKRYDELMNKINESICNYVSNTTFVNNNNNNIITEICNKSEETERGEINNVAITSHINNNAIDNKHNKDMNNKCNGKFINHTIERQTNNNNMDDNKNVNVNRYKRINNDNVAEQTTDAVIDNHNKSNDKNIYHNQYECSHCNVKLKTHKLFEIHNRIHIQQNGQSNHMLRQNTERTDLLNAVNVINHFSEKII
eukprot:395209_1